MVSERSYRMSMLTDAGISARNFGSRFFTASVTAMVLVPGWRWMPRMMARCVPWLGVEPGSGLVVLHAVDDVAELFQADRRAIAIGDDQRPVLRGAHQLAGGLQGECALRSDDAAGGQVDVPAPTARSELR